MSDDQAVGICKLAPNSIHPRVVVVGAPERAEEMMEYMDSFELYARNREYYTFNCVYKGVPVTVMSHGVGGGGASMCFEEAVNAGAKVMIRAGTCGSFQPELTEGSLIVATGAVRLDGVSDRLVPIQFPAICDHTVVQSLIDSVKAREDIVTDAGIVLTDGPFYAGLVPNDFELYAKANVKCVEMECSVLFTICSIRGIKAGAILTTDNYIFQRLGNDEGYKPHRDVVKQGVKNMCQVALDAVIAVEP
eukprot:TRINITY_DN10376_c0_g1_i1.p1 TRINITY_DN10376_c0_g1~~TRINITY_DN10376_c0_g1_i1.p1  ORF type:complete len:248 (-),score=59.65 TRINITY_DN10376_c0_g1_i1:99-842(-)